MQIKKHVKFPLAAFALASTLAGCVTLQWMVKYQDPDKYYSTGNAVAIDPQGNAIMGGFVETRGVGLNGRTSFVAKYDQKGNLLWDYRFTDSPGDPIYGVNHLLTDANGNVYATENRIETTTPIYSTSLLVTKLDSAGNRIWQWHSNALPWAGHPEIRPDGNIYFSTLSSDLIELSPTGDELWSINSVATAPPLTGLGASLTSLRNLGASLQLLSSTGEILVSFQSSQLGIGEISQAFIQGDAVVVLGTTTNGFGARRIQYSGGEFILDNDNVAHLSSSVVGASPSPAGGFCYITNEFDSANNVSSAYVAYVDSNLLLKWKSTVQMEADDSELMLVDVESTGSRCYAEYHTYKSNKVTSIVLVNDIATGKSRSRVTMSDFAVNDLAVKDDIVVQGGMSGPYTTADGTTATLTRHKVD